MKTLKKIENLPMMTDLEFLAYERCLRFAINRVRDAFKIGINDETPDHLEYAILDLAMSVYKQRKLDFIEV